MVGEVGEREAHVPVHLLDLVVEQQESLGHLGLVHLELSTLLLQELDLLLVCLYHVQQLVIHAI